MPQYEVEGVVTFPASWIVKAADEDEAIDTINEFYGREPDHIDFDFMIGWEAVDAAELTS